MKPMSGKTFFSCTDAVMFCCCYCTGLSKGNSPAEEERGLPGCSPCPGKATTHIMWAIHGPTS